MPAEAIEQSFENIAGKYAITSDLDSIYNCIAWAMGENHRWWDPCPYPGYYWPEDKERTDTVEVLESIFRDRGYVPCTESVVEVGYEKVAIYGNGNVYEHAARLLPEGDWTSKLGPDEDVSHIDLESMQGRLYGEVRRVMKRLLPAGTRA